MLFLSAGPLPCSPLQSDFCHSLLTSLRPPSLGQVSLSSPYLSRNPFLRCPSDPPLTGRFAPILGLSQAPPSSGKPPLASAGWVRCLPWAPAAPLTLSVHKSVSSGLP